MDKIYQSQQAEKTAQEQWLAENTYAAENNPGPLYSIDTPPPTVSGALHIGHVFSYTQTDIIARYKRMRGFSVYYPFGFDDNGLPTERFVEKKRGISAHMLKRSEFIQICLEETALVEKQFQELWQRLGLSVDWSQCYSTIDARTRNISQASFIRLYKKGFVYRKNEPALYCPTCRTSVAQAELDDAEKPSTFNDIAFTDSTGKQLIISTTRPELLPSCVALFYNPADARYQHLLGTKARVPLFNIEVPIIADELVQIDKGTGLVMCCTFGDKTDIAWFKKHNLPYRPSIGRDGKFLPETGILVGLKITQAREKILEELKKAGTLLNQRAIIHAVNIHERCKQDIEYLMLPQWFLSLLPYKQHLIELADQIAWYPEHMKARYKNWVENISWDWCLSRQRFYGIPFPAWHCQSCHTILLADENQLPVDPQEIAYNGTCPLCSSSDIIPDTDVMDTWNTSSLTPYICAAMFYEDEDIFERSHTFIPMSMRPQAHDIIRTWAFYTIVKSWMHDSKIPWQSIVISGHVQTDGKEKISKSQANSPLAPENLLVQYSADAIRYWTASASLGQDVAFSENQLKIGQRLLTKLWNAFRFMGEHKVFERHSPARPERSHETAESNGYERSYGFDFTSLRSPRAGSNQLGTINSWILHRAHETYQSFCNYFERHEFSLALDIVEKFFWQDFCDNYLELVKDQFFNPESYIAEEIAATRWTLSVVGLRILQLYASFIPHITETLYAQFYRQSCGIASVHQTRFENVQVAYTDEQAVHTMRGLNAVVAAIRKLKSDNKLSLKVDLGALVIVAPSEMLNNLRACEQALKGVTRAQTILYEMPTGDQITKLEQRDDIWYATVVIYD